MQVTITAVGPDNIGLADPIVHLVTLAGANIHEIQMYDRDDEKLFAMLLRIEWTDKKETIVALRERLYEIGRMKGLTIRVWSRDEHDRPPRIAICTTYRPEPAQAILHAIKEGQLEATPAVMMGNRDSCRKLAEEFDVDWHMIADDAGNPDNSHMNELFDQYEVDYIVLARYMRILPPSTCWQFSGGRILNLHHGLLPSFPGFRPYEDAFEHNMLTYGATVHFIIPELDAGNQIINQETFSVFPGTPLKQIKKQGESKNETSCLLEGLRRVVDREVELHFHRIVSVNR